jgi:Zn-finger domain-containing protein
MTPRDNFRQVLRAMLIPESELNKFSFSTSSNHNSKKDVPFSVDDSLDLEGVDNFKMWNIEDEHLKEDLQLNFSSMKQSELEANYFNPSDVDRV